MATTFIMKQLLTNSYVPCEHEPRSTKDNFKDRYAVAVTHHFTHCLVFWQTQQLDSSKNLDSSKKLDSSKSASCISTKTVKLRIHPPDINFYVLFCVA